MDEGFTCPPQQGGGYYSSRAGGGGGEGRQLEEEESPSLPLRLRVGCLVFCVLYAAYVLRSVVSCEYRVVCYGRTSYVCEMCALWYVLLGACFFLCIVFLRCAISVLC